MFKTLGVGAAFGVVLLMIVLVVLGPWVVIWAWNILFGSLYAIPYTLYTWLAVLILGTYIRSPVKVTKS